MSRIRNLLRLWWRWEWPSLLRSITPVWLVSGLVAAVIFGRNGMHPRDITEPVSSTIATRLALFVVWGLSTTPSLLAHAHASCRELLISQPIASVEMAAVLWGSAIMVHLPLALLAFAGSGPGLAITLVSSVLAIQSHVWIAVHSHNTRVTSFARVGLVSVCLLVPLPDHADSAFESVRLAVAALISTMLALWGLHGMWRRELDEKRDTQTRTFSSVPVRALVQNYVLALWRTNGMALVRAGLLSLSGGALTALLLRNREEVSLRASWAVISVTESIVLVMCASVVSFPVLEQERQQAALFDSLHVRSTERLRASAWVLLAGNLASAATFWTGNQMVSSLLRTTSSGAGWTLLHNLCAGLGVSMLVEWWIRRTPDRNNAVLGLAGMAIGGAVVGGQLGVWWSPLLGVLGALACGARTPLQEAT